MREFSQYFSRFYTTGMQAGEHLEELQGPSWQPPVDIFEQDDAIVVVAEIPGVERDQITATVESGVLRIRGFRTKRLPDRTSRVHQMEIPYGQFMRSLRLPADTDVEQIEAEYEDGYLTIRIPRTARNAQQEHPAERGREG